MGDSTKRKSSWSWWVPFLIMCGLVAAAIVSGFYTWQHGQRIAGLRKNIEEMRSAPPATERPVTDAQLIANVNEFYNQSWIMLIVTFAIGGGLIGIVVPAVIQRLHHESFEKREEDLRAKISQQLAKSKDELQDIHTNAFRYADHASGFHWYFAGTLAVRTEQWQLAWRFYCYAVNSFVSARELSRVRWSTNRLLEISKDPIQSAEVLKSRELQGALEETVNYLQKITFEPPAASAQKERLEAECIKPLESLLAKW